MPLQVKVRASVSSFAINLLLLLTAISFTGRIVDRALQTLMQLERALIL